MPISPPTYPILCNLYTSDDPLGTLRVFHAPCNLAWGSRVNVPSTGGTSAIGVPLVTTQIIVPPTTDIRGASSTTGSDACEVPAGSGRWYTVVYADFAGLGFPNVHKNAILQQHVPFKTPDT